MLSALVAVGAVILFAAVLAIVTKQRKDKRNLELHSITPDELHTLLSSGHRVLLYDVRQPLDLLADSEIIRGATRIPPRDVMENPSLIPQDKDAVVYCTCPDDETSRMVLRRAERLHFTRIKFLKGGLAAWKAKGYPVEPYTKPFHLDTRA